jgi:uncharacterized protein YukE
METGVVHRTGGSAQDVAAKVPTKAAFDTTEEAVYQHRELASGQALDGCLAAWTKHLQEVSDRISTTAERLHQAASSYANSDATVAADMDRAVADLGVR